MLGKKSMSSNHQDMAPAPDFFYFVLSCLGLVVVVVFFSFFNRVSNLLSSQ